MINCHEQNVHNVILHIKLGLSETVFVLSSIGNVTKYSKSFQYCLKSIRSFTTAEHYANVYSQHTRYKSNGGLVYGKEMYSIKRENKFYLKTKGGLNYRYETFINLHTLARGVCLDKCYFITAKGRES